jgi:hypothetical protein
MTPWGALCLNEPMTPGLRAGAKRSTRTQPAFKSASNAKMGDAAGSVPGPRCRRGRSVPDLRRRGEAGATTIPGTTRAGAVRAHPRRRDRSVVHPVRHLPGGAERVRPQPPRVRAFPFPAALPVLPRGSGPTAGLIPLKAVADHPDRVTRTVKPGLGGGAQKTHAGCCSAAPGPSQRRGATIRRSTLGRGNLGPGGSHMSGHALELSPRPPGTTGHGLLTHGVRPEPPCRGTRLVLRPSEARSHVRAQE